MKNTNESTWRHILFVILVCAYYSVRGQHALAKNSLRRFGLSRGVLPYSMFERLSKSSDGLLISGCIMPTYDLNLINFEYRNINNYIGKNFLSYFELLRNFRQHYDSLRGENNPFAEKHLPTNIKISAIFKLFNFLPRAYPFLLCLMKLLCPGNHDIHLYLDIHNSDLPDIENIDSDSDVFIEYMKAIFVVLFQLNKSNFTTYFLDKLKTDWNKAYLGP